MKQAEDLHNELKDTVKYHYLNIDTLDYKDGVILAPTFLVKGLEFDAVIIVDADENLYKENVLDAKLLYIAMTRAMHKLDVFFVGEKSKLLEEDF